MTSVAVELLLFILFAVWGILQALLYKAVQVALHYTKNRWIVYASDITYAIQLLITTVLFCNATNYGIVRWYTLLAIAAGAMLCVKTCYDTIDKVWARCVNSVASRIKR